MTDSKCSVCGESMLESESMFKFHGYSGPCPKPPLPQPHQRRVVDEKAALDVARSKLYAFITTNLTFQTLDTAEQCRLHMQNGYMKAYSDVLGERIKAWTAK